MKKSRLIVTLMLVALLVTSIAIPAMASTQNSNDGFYFRYGPGEQCAYSATSMFKDSTSGWMIDVHDTDYRDRDVTYAMLWTLYSDWSWCVGSQTRTHRNTGLVEGEYVNASQVVGWEFWAGAMKNTSDLSNTFFIEGQWNTDR